MSVRKESISITGPAGTALSPRPINGRILEVRYNGTTLNGGAATSDYTITRKDTGGTILALTDQNGPWQFAPRQNTHTNAGAVAGTALGYIPVASHIQVVIAQGGTATDSIHILYDDAAE